MILDDDAQLLNDYESLITSDPSEENLKACGCILVKDRHNSEQDWAVIYGGERYEFTKIRFSDRYQLRIYCKHYTNNEKTAWISFGCEYADNVKELFDWIRAEIEFYKDHPEEKPGTPEYKRKEERDLLIGKKLESIRWSYNQAMSAHSHRYIGWGPIDSDDVEWYMLFEKACKEAQQERPELFEE